MTWSAPSDLTRSRFLVPHTAVTSAPKCRDSWTAAVPMDPEAPYTRMLRPFPTSAGRRPIRARITPSQTAAASSKPTPAGLRASAALSRMQTYSAWAPNVQALTPKTSSPAVNSVTAGPAASTTPASSLPRIRCRGRRSPVSRRATCGVPARVSVSERLTVVARILIKTSSGRGTGRSTSSSRRTSGGPYRSQTTAFISAQHAEPALGLLAWSSSGSVRAAAGFLPHPGQVRRRPGHDGQGDDLRLVIAVAFGEEGGELVVAVDRELEEHEPLLGPLQTSVPPVHRRHRAGHLRARGQPGLDRGPGELHRLRARVGRRLYLEVLHLKVGHGPDRTLTGP